MNDLINSIEQAKVSIENTTEKLYQNKTEEGYAQLNDTLIVLSNTVNNIFNYKQQGNEIGIEENQLIEVLTEAMNSMENKDTILLADILQYELKELLDKILEAIV